MAQHLLRILLAITISITIGVGLAYANMPDQVDRVVVKKSNRMLALYQGEQVIRTYPISLGKNPIGHKVRRGDKRTPEGRYKIDWRNPDSRYHLALHISYPNSTDRSQASRLGVSPGGSIMLHGLPPKFADGDKVMLDLDWTDGCIAVSNQAIEEIWQMVTDNTVIEIWP
jgi:murein L,D-transpeptidase YafK